MTIKLDNPILIDRMKVGETLEGRKQVELFSGALKHPALRMPTYQYGFLFDVGFDPNQMEAGKTYYTRFFAQWEAGKANSEGNAYKNVVRLIPSERENDNLLREIQAIKTLLSFLAEQQAGSREALVAWYQERHEAR